LDVGQHVGIIPVFLVWMVVWGDIDICLSWLFGVICG